MSTGTVAGADRLPAPSTASLLGEQEDRYPCSSTRLRFARKPLFCLGSIMPIIGCMIFIQPDTLIWTRRVNFVPPRADDQGGLVRVGDPRGAATEHRRAVVRRGALRVLRRDRDRAGRALSDAPPG